jgi:hypothetical protein
VRAGSNGEEQEMQRTATARRPFALAALFALVISAFAIAGPPAANADTFTTGKAAPVVTITAYPDDIQPYFMNTTTPPLSAPAVAYTVTVTVVDSDGVDTIDLVEVCFYNSDSSLAACQATDANPKTTFLMDWDSSVASPTFGADQSGTDGFALGRTGTNYALGSDFSAAPGGTDQRSSWSTSDELPSTLTLNFRFYASNAMLAGDDWTVVATAIDEDDETGSAREGFDAPTGYIFVNYWGEVTTARASVDYGTIDAGEFTDRENEPLGSFVANDDSLTKLAGEDFTFTPVGGGGPFTLDLVEFDEPGIGQVSLLCSLGTALDPNDAIFVPASGSSYLVGTVFGGSGAARGTGEAPQSLAHSCRLAYGGGATVSSAQYQADITVTIEQD